MFLQKNVNQQYKAVVSFLSTRIISLCIFSADCKTLVTRQITLRLLFREFYHAQVFYITLLKPVLNKKNIHCLIYKCEY